MNESENCCRIDINNILIQNATILLQDEKNLLEQKSKLFSLLGNEVRLKIIRLFLDYDKMCVCDLSDVLEMNQSPISQHLRKLKDGGILVSKRNGMTIFYSVKPSIKEHLTNIVKG